MVQVRPQEAVLTSQVAESPARKPRLAGKVLRKRVPVQGDASVLMEAFAAQMQSLEARLMANVTAQLHRYPDSVAG